MAEIENFRERIEAAKRQAAIEYSVNPGNENDGRTFKPLMDKIDFLPIELVVGDTAHKTQAIARMLKLKNIELQAHTANQKPKRAFSRSTITYMMSSTIALFARQMRS